MLVTLNIEEFDELILMHQQVMEEFSVLREYIPIPECIDVKFICSKLSLSKATVYSSPWLMPNFGKSEYSSATKRWKWETWKTWQKRSEVERRNEWLSLPQRTKEEIMGVRQ